MTVATVNGLEIAYEIIGDGGQTWALTPGGRFSKDYGGVRELAQGLAGTGRRVLIWDRPNCGESSVSFQGPRMRSPARSPSQPSYLGRYDPPTSP